MSGPKVVRIVTEEERIAICETQIALLNAETQLLLDYLKAQKINDTSLEKTIKKKLAHYKKVLTPDKYREVPRMIQKELDYISFEFNRFRSKELEKARSKQLRTLHLFESLKTLQMLTSSLSSDITPNTVLKYSELCGKSEAEILKIEQKVSLEFSELSSRRKKDHIDVDLTSEQKETRNRLISAESEVNVSEWKLTHSDVDNQKVTNSRIDIVMADLDEMKFPESRKIKYQKRLDGIFEEESEQHRILMLDSFVINLAKEAKDFDQLKKTRHDLLKIKAQVDTLEEEEALQLSMQIEKALVSENISVLKKMQEAATRKMTKIIESFSIERGRKALLEALKSLGYTVSEGMETAVVENGKLVVKKQTEEIYGVEVQNIGTTGKFQLRLVSGLPDNERSTKDDIAEEKKWCDDLTKIRESLDDSNIELEIEKALDPGAATVKYSEKVAEFVDLNKRRVTNLRANKLNN